MEFQWAEGSDVKKTTEILFLSPHEMLIMLFESDVSYSLLRDFNKEEMPLL